MPVYQKYQRKACEHTRDFLARHALQAREILRRLGPDVSAPAPPSHSVHDTGIRVEVPESTSGLVGMKLCWYNQLPENPGRRREHRYQLEVSNIIRSSLRGCTAYITELRTLLSQSYAGQN